MLNTLQSLQYHSILAGRTSTAMASRLTIASAA